MTRRFGYGYEKKSPESPSTQIARAEFLSLVLQLNPEVISNLFNLGYQPFERLIAVNQTEITAICDSVKAELPPEPSVLRQPKIINARAIKILVPNERSLHKLQEAAELCRVLQDWACTHNLGNDWCLDQGVAFFRQFYGSDDKKLALALTETHFLAHLLRRSWLSASIERRLEASQTQYQANIEVEDRGIYLFNFKYENLEFSVTGPFFKSISTFREEVDREFAAHKGATFRGARKALTNQLRSYLADVEKVTEELGLEKPPVRWAEDHFKWLIHYQLPPCKGYRAIGRQLNRDEATIREGVQDVAALIGLTLRPSERGRPKGTQDMKARHRATRAKCGEIQT